MRTTIKRWFESRADAAWALALLVFAFADVILVLYVLPLLGR